MADDPMIGKRLSVFWPEEKKWFEGVVTEKGQDASAVIEGRYNNVGYR